MSSVAMTLVKNVPEVNDKKCKQDLVDKEGKHSLYPML